MREWYDTVLAVAWKKWQKVSPVKAVQFFIDETPDWFKGVESDELSFDSVEAALDAIPQPLSSSTTVRVHTALKDMKSLDVVMKTWAKDGAKHTAECVHVLNDNLKLVADKLDKHHELMLNIMHVPEKVVPGTFHASLANLQKTIDDGFTSLHGAVQLYGNKGDGNDGEPASKKA